MLQNIRDKAQKSLVFKGIVLFIALMFVLWGVHATIVQLSQSEEIAAAHVNDEPILELDLKAQLDMYRQQMISQQVDPSTIDEVDLRKRTLNSMIEHEVLQQTTKNYQLYFSDEAIQKLIQEIEMFQTDGKFDPSKLDKFLIDRNITYKKLVKLLRQDQQIDQLRNGIENTAFATQQDIALSLQLDNQLRDGAFAVIYADDFVKKIDVTDQQIKDYYEKNQESFLSEENISVNYIELNKKEFSKNFDVTDEEIKQQYNDEVQLIKAREQRKAAHILIAVSDAVSDAQAKTKILEIEQKLQKGESFESLAKNYSDDKGSAINGGDLGFAGKGAYDPNFEAALFALQPQTVSQPVKTQFGYHLIKLLDIQTAEVPSLDSIADDLRAKVADKKATAAFAAKIEQLSTLVYESKDLEAPAKELGLPVQQTELFGREGGEGIAQNPAVVAAAFSEDVLKGLNSEVIELDPDHVVVVNVRSYHEAAVEPLEDVKDQVVSELKLQEARKLAIDEGKAVVNKLQLGDAMEKVTDAYKLRWSNYRGLNRVSKKENSDIVKHLFKLPKPEADQKVFGGYSMENGDYAVLMVSRVYQDTDKQAIEKREKGIANYLNINHGRLDSEDLLVQLKNYSGNEIELSK